MKAVQVFSFGGPEELIYSDNVSVPVPSDRQVLIRNSYAGLNFKDTLTRSGAYHGGNPTLPFIPGIEASGIIEAIGDKVNNFCVGDRVAYMTGTMGTKDNNCYAEYTVFDSSSNITGVPDGIGLDQACASMVQGLTAHYLTTDAYKVKANNLVLIHGAGGGLGMILTQLCKRVGAKVIGTCSSPKKEQVARDNGCDFVINYLNNNFAEKVLSITNGHGVDVIYDGVGKTTFLSGFDALCKRGTMVLFGNACGEHPDPIEPTLLSQKGSITLIRPALYDYLLSQEEMHARCKELFLYMLDGTLQIPISATLDLCESIQAHNDLLHRKVSGKILFTIDSKVI